MFYLVKFCNPLTTHNNKYDRARKTLCFNSFSFTPQNTKKNLAKKDLTGKRINVTNIEKLALKLVSCFLNLISENNITAVKHIYIIFYRNLI